VEALWIVVVVSAFLLIIFLILAFKFPEDLTGLLRRLSAVEVTKEGLKMQLLAEAVYEKERRKPEESELRPLVRDLTRGGRILWVDDLPANNRAEIQALRGLGLTVDVATSNQEALSYVKTNRYDLILSDIGRAPPEAPSDGLKLPELLGAAGVTAPIAFYVGQATASTTQSGQPVFDAPTEVLSWVRNNLKGAHQ